MNKHKLYNYQHIYCVLLAHLRQLQEYTCHKTLGKRKLNKMVEHGKAVHTEIPSDKNLMKQRRNYWDHLHIWQVSAHT